MITNTGKSIIGKFLLGQTTSYASHIGIGCGKKPLLLSDPTPEYPNQQNLDFEMVRVPVSSRGIVSEDGNTQIVLTAELPSEERYEITEVGIFSSGSNPSAGSYDSKTVFGFTDTENWQYFNGSSASDIPKITQALDSLTAINIIDVNGKTDINTGTALSSDVPVFETNADNSVFYDTGRLSRYERLRFFNNTILMRGDTSSLTANGSGHFTSFSGGYIFYPSAIASFAQNSPNDELRLALSIINKSGTTSPDKVNVLINFKNSDGTKYSRFEEVMTDGTGSYDFDNNRYYVITKKLKDLYTSTEFEWGLVTQVQIFVEVEVAGSTSDDYYVALDALRLENVSTLNPLYGLTGYSVIKTGNGQPVIKSTNTSNYIEFRFNLEAT